MGISSNQGGTVEVSVPANASPSPSSVPLSNNLGFLDGGWFSPETINGFFAQPLADTLAAKNTALTAKAQAQQFALDAEGYATSLQAITVNGVVVSLVATASQVPVADAQGALDATWIPEVGELIILAAQNAIFQINTTNRLLAAGIL